MAGSGNNSDDGEVSGINVTPLVDVMLVLLCIFMATTQLIQKEKDAIPIEVPKAAAGGSNTAKTFAVVITKEGGTYIDGKPASDAEIAQKIRESPGPRDQMQALISADTMATHGKVIHVMDLLKTNGVTKFAFEIEKPQ